MRSCTHDRLEKRVRKGLRGLVTQEQCLDCLRPVGLPCPMGEYGLQQGLVYWKRRPHPTKRRRRYLERLRRPSWRKLRTEILIRDNWTCRMCGEAATEVHHLTYARLGREKPEDLVASCFDCNQAERVA